MNKIKLFLVVGVFLLGLLLKFHNYDVYPQRGATSDEFTYSFLGVSLLTKGVPTSWSFLGTYKHLTPITIDHIYFPIVYPYFDHPPLNGLLVGGWAILNGERSFQTIHISTIRIVPITLSTISALLLFLIMLRLFQFQSAFFALLIYTTTTTFVMNGRVVFAENLLTPLLLGALYLFVLYSKKMTISKTIFLGIFAGLSFWTKELGIITYVSLAFLFLVEKIHWKYFVLLSFVFGLFVMGYIGYGSYYDASVFWKTIFVQSSRIIGTETLYALLVKPIIVNKFYTDGWYIFGLLSLFYLFKDFKKYAYLLVPSFLYFFLLLFSITKDGEMGWYMIVLFPFMAMAAGVVIEQALQKNWLMLFFVLFVGMYEVQYLYSPLFGLTTNQFRVILSLLFVPLLLGTVFLSEKGWRRMSLVYFCALILGNIYLTYAYIHPA